MEWQHKQHFSLRASTLLVLYAPVLFALAALSAVVPGSHSGYLQQFVAASAWSLPVLMVFAAVFSLSFFIESIVRRHPQIQFALEFFIVTIQVDFSFIWLVVLKINAVAEGMKDFRT